MPRAFEIPVHYHSNLLSEIKRRRTEIDPKKKDKSPTIITTDKLILKFSRHFGFCFGVENAIDIAYRAVDENPGKRIFLLSEMIHNPHVNADLEGRGVRFLFSTYGEERIPLGELRSDDVVIIPAFGTTLEMFSLLKERGVDIQKYNTTCPFVEKVWKRGSQLGSKGFTIIIHGKARHEETRATFSHASQDGPSLIIADVAEAKWLRRFILGEESRADFEAKFSGRWSEGFQPEQHLERIGVINQTTMLATETWEISQILKSAMEEKFGRESLLEHFADTRDTLCYATSENQESTKELISSGGDLALIVGGYNSSNTSHLVELCEEHFPSYFIKGPEELASLERISHLDLHTWQVKEGIDWYPKTITNRPIEVVITSGASCPDALVERVVERLLGLLQISRSAFEESIERYFLSLKERFEGESSSLRLL